MRVIMRSVSAVLDPIHIDRFIYIYIYMYMSMKRVCVRICDYMYIYI